MNNYERFYITSAPMGDGSRVYDVKDHINGVFVVHAEDEKAAIEIQDVLARCAA